jgi:hypothetical protein
MKPTSIIRTDGTVGKLTVEALVQTYRALQAQAPQPVSWAVIMPYRAWKEERRVLRMMMLRVPLRVRRRTT